jgi:L-alanine-DL-glutamate epimerase-like enolase superfamily enzyme
VTRISRLDVSACTIPTDRPESDGTLEWDRTTMVLVEVEAGGTRGLGYTYADVATAVLVRDRLEKLVVGRDPMAPGAAWLAMVAAIRNLGRPGIVSMAISAVDAALWDLKARLCGLPLVELLGPVRDGVPVYGSGGFTSYTPKELEAQLSGWAAEGIRRVKMKVGRDAAADRERVRAAREAIGKHAELFVDANGAYTRKQALAQADAFAASGVRWFEEPVSSDDLDGLRLVRDRAPAGMDVAAGEYGYDLVYFRRMLEAHAVDVLQADVGRAGGVTGFLEVAALCDAHQLPLSAHTAPALSLHVCCAAPRVRHLEWFHDHVRIEQLLFDGVT